MKNVEYAKNRIGTNSEKWDGLKKHYGEGGLLPLWVADMDFKSPSCVINALKEACDFGVFGYYSLPESSCESFINWELRRHNLKLEKNWLRFAPGVMAGINWLVNSLTAPEDAVMVFVPVYFPFLKAVKTNNRKLITLELSNNAGNYSIDLEAFENAVIKNNVKMLIFCSPHNPVGRVWRKDELKSLFDLCKKHNVFIVSDEIHQDIIIKGTQIPALSFPEYHNMTAMVTAATKTFNLAGLVNAVVVMPDENIRKRFDEYTSHIDCHRGSMLSYIAVEAAYTGGEAWLDEVLEIISENAEYIRNICSKSLPDVIISPLEGTYLFWMDFKAYLKPEDQRDFFQKKCRLALNYGDWFGGEKSKTFIRVNLATDKENIKIMMDQIVKNLPR